MFFQLSESYKKALAALVTWFVLQVLEDDVTWSLREEATSVTSHPPTRSCSTFSDSFNK